MTEQGNIALNFHLNLNHRALQPEQRERFLEQDLAELAGCIEVPTTISACAEDLLIVRNESPQSWEAITANPNVYIAPSFYSHALAELFPGEVVASARIGTQITRAILPEKKIIPFGYPPELSAPPHDTVEALREIWQGTIFSDIRAQSQKPDQQLPAAFISPEGLQYHAAIRKLSWRKTLHAFLRGTVESEVVIDALQADAKAYAAEGPLIAILDLETPILNEAWDGSDKSRPSVALFAKLQRDLRCSRLHFSVLGEDDSSPQKLPVVEAPLPSKTATDRWNRQDLVHAVSEFAYNTDYQRMLFLSSLCSDYFMPPERDLALPTLFDGVFGEMCMHNDGEARSREIAVKLAALENNTTLDQATAPGHDPYLCMTHQATEQAVLLSQLALANV